MKQFQYLLYLVCTFSLLLIGCNSDDVKSALTIGGIANGSTKPNAADGTDFGTVALTAALLRDKNIQNWPPVFVKEMKQILRKKLGSFSLTK